MKVWARIRDNSVMGTLEIMPHVYQLTIIGINIILIAEEELTLVDTGFPGSSAQIVNFIHRLGHSAEQISLIIITHNHIDHAGGLAELRKLTRAKVAAHKADITDTGEQPPYPGVVGRLLRIPPLSGLHSVFSITPGEVDIRLEGGEVLKPLGGLRVIHTPGHTSGSISLFSPLNRLLIVSDALNEHYRTIRLPPKSVSHDLAQAIESVKTISRLDFDILCFGHGRPLTGDVSSKMQELLEKIKA